MNFPSAEGAVALVLPAADWTNKVGAVQAGINFVVYGNGTWRVANWNGAGESPTYARKVSRPAVRKGDVPIMVRVNYANATATVLLPDGSQVAVNNVLVDNIGRFAVWQLYENARSHAPAKIKALWAQGEAP